MSFTIDAQAAALNTSEPDGLDAPIGIAPARASHGLKIIVPRSAPIGEQKADARPPSNLRLPPPSSDGLAPAALLALLPDTASSNMEASSTTMATLDQAAECVRKSALRMAG